MNRFAITCLALLLAFTVLPAWGQDATVISVRDLNSIPQDQIDILNAGGENLDAATIEANIYNEVAAARTRVEITVVLLSDPLNSGLGSVDGVDPDPSRVHVFTRDIAAETEGVEGMGIQIVDGAFPTTGMLNFGIGDVVTIVGSVSPFGTTMQVSPETITFQGFYTDLGLSDSILDPVVVTSDEINQAVGIDGVQANWSNLAMLRGQYVRIEGGTLQARANIDQDRVDFHVSSDGGATVANFYDTSVQFRNDRTDYPAEFNFIEDDDFVPPPVGSRLNYQGFVVFQAFADQIGRSQPDNAILSVAPMERRGCLDAGSGFGCDLEVTETPPAITGLGRPDFVPSASSAVDITVDIVPDPTRTIAGAELIYSTSSDATEQRVGSSAQSGDAYTFSIPAANDGDFVTYRVEATDNLGAISETNTLYYRVLDGGITQISEIQETPDGNPGNGPFDGITTDMDLTVTVQTQPGLSGLISVQDDASLAPWTGIQVSDSDLEAVLNQGDVIRITNAEIQDNFGLSRLRSLTYEVVSTGGDPLPALVITTDALQDAAIAEAHEGMYLRFEGVEVTDAFPDAPNDFGEFSFSSIGLASPLRADDTSDDFSGDFNDDLVVGQQFDFIQGMLTYSFGNYKLLPESLADIGMNTAVEDELLPESFSLGQNYPNPFNPTTSIRFEAPVTGPLSLDVFDVLGRKVATLVEGTRTAGAHTVSFDAGDLGSGLYLYRLTAGTQVLTRTMLLVK